MVERRHQDLVGIPGPMQCEAGSKLGELVIPRHCRYCRQSWVRKRLKRILSILEYLTLLFTISIHHLRLHRLRHCHHRLSNRLRGGRTEHWER